MKKILSIDEAAKLSAKLRRRNNLIVLAGGCFDIIHKGHKYFLEQAKNQGDILLVLLESDENIKRLKGEKRPINKQLQRIKNLQQLPSVDYIIPLTGVTKDSKYDKLIVQIRPDVIAATKGDPQEEKRQQQCEKVGAKLKMIEKTQSPSTTDLVKNL